MSEVKKDGGPAFPQERHMEAVAAGDMSLRDWLAGQVDIQDYTFSDFETAAKCLGIDPPFDRSADELTRFAFRMQAAIRYGIADAMLAERSK